MKTITINVPDDCEVQIVRKEEKKESVIRTYQDLIDNKIPSRGYYIDSFSELEPVNDGNFDSCHDRNIAASEKVAKSMLAMAIISQLMPYYGGEITDEEWNNDDIKYIIFIFRAQVVCGITYNNNTFLAFHTAKQRDNFLKYNERLVKDFLMID